MIDWTGDVVQHYGYTAFGKEWYSIPESQAFKVTNRYTGQKLDEDTGLYFYGSRYYDPELGRFVQPDSVVPSATTSQSLNRYAYVVNNPLKYDDPTGHGNFFKEFIGTIIFVALVVFNPLVAYEWSTMAYAAVSAGISTIVNHGTFSSFMLGMGVSIMAAGIASPFGNSIGGFAQGFGESMGKIVAAAMQGALIGAISGAITSAVYGQNIWQGMGQGALSGVIGAGVGIATKAVLSPFVSGGGGTVAEDLGIHVGNTPDGEIMQPLTGDTSNWIAHASDNLPIDPSGPPVTGEIQDSWWAERAFVQGLGHGGQIAANKYSFGLTDRFGLTSGDSLVSRYGAVGRISEGCAGWSRDLFLSTAAPAGLSKATNLLAESKWVGKGSYLFGRGGNFGAKGIFNTGTIRTGWGWNAGGGGQNVFRTSWAPRGQGSFWNHLDYFGGKP